jgi:hypothetical protein
VKRKIAVSLALAWLAGAQQEEQKKKAPPPEKKEEPAPLFGGQLGVRSSQKTKESATLGFNGIDPSGKVDQKMLATSPGSKDQQIVKKMAENRPKQAELIAFLKEGGLNQK